MLTIITHNGCIAWSGPGLHIYPNLVVSNEDPEKRGYVIRLERIQTEDYGLAISPTLTKAGADALMASLSSELYLGLSFNIRNWLVNKTDYLYPAEAK